MIEFKVCLLETASFVVFFFLLLFLYLILIAEQLILCDKIPAFEKKKHFERLPNPNE